MAIKSIYLIAKYYVTPVDPSQTKIAGYMKSTENTTTNEQVYLTRGLHDKDLKNTVVLNLTEEKIVKNGFKSGANFEELFKHFYDSYADYIDSAVNTLNNG